jgi:hypothetical protein
MRKGLLIVLLFAVTSGYAQFKDDNIFKPTVREGIITHSPNLIFGFINPDNLIMNHSYSMSYTTFGGNGVALGVYTNSLLFKFADNLNLEVDASLVHSPYSSFGKNHQNMLNGIYLSKAQLNYQPWDNFNISVQYRSLPGNYYSPYSGFYGYNRNFFNNNLFIDD